ncbi:hypothetical protein, partial [Klebsiella pneumoniae]|uniref:hypothetical protein n=1 Tax=Klebsiella pneumoniae TaxID=573 RepID=UPI001BE0884F
KFLKVKVGNGDFVEIGIDLPWKPSRCEKCKVFGHSLQKCPLSSPKVVRNIQEWRKKGTHVIPQVVTSNVDQWEVPASKTTVAIDSNMKVNVP